MVSTVTGEARMWLITGNACIGRSSDVLLDFLKIGIHLFEGIGSSGSVLLKLILQQLLSMGQVFDVSPRPEDLGSFDPRVHLMLISEVRVVKLSVVPQQETGKVKSQVRLVLIVT